MKILQRRSSSSPSAILRQLSATWCSPSILKLGFDSGLDIEVIGTGATRTVRAFGLPDQFGSSTITLQVTDGGVLSATEEFIVNVLPINDSPRSLNVSPFGDF